MADSAKNILNILLDNGRTSRADLARKLKLSRPAISAAVEKLLAAGLLREGGFGVSSGGKPPIILEFSPQEVCAVGLDIGDGNAMRAVLLDGNAEVIDRAEAEVASDFSSVCRTAERLTRLLVARSPHHRVNGIGAAVPGVVDAGRNRILFCANFELAGGELDFASTLESATGLPVLLRNRARSAAAAEWRGGAAADYRDFVYVTFGSGIGSVIHHNGTMLNGKNHSAGEIRDMIVRSSDTGFSRLEPAILDLYKKHGATPESAAFYIPVCTDMVRMLAAITDPDTVIFGGKFKQLGAGFLDELTFALKSALPARREPPTLKFAAAGADGAACGAAFKRIREYIAQRTEEGVY
ncbi:MAG: ROK family transcriptional regulator [Victivallaceae bacterium]|nr:ROK family transcriptional regulator [Victivallaceae bacterium]